MTCISTSDKHIDVSYFVYYSTVKCTAGVNLRKELNGSPSLRMLLNRLHGANFTSKFSLV